MHPSSIPFHLEGASLGDLCATTYWLAYDGLVVVAYHRSLVNVSSIDCNALNPEVWLMYLLGPIDNVCIPN